ncbi:hypothetical protein MNB_SV-9-1733 [hydrothermal vent metagenome]|uniref:Uncharacterized protein n=1 Tax=hydrothermal vent metagenome TaxID=652676 RepID=A0A1W1CH14_9ZZZZ
MSATDEDDNTSTRNIAVSVLSAEDNADAPVLTMSIGSVDTITYETNNFDNDKELWDDSDGGSDITLGTDPEKTMKIDYANTATETFTGLEAGKEVSISFETSIGSGWDDSDDEPTEYDHLDITLNDSDKVVYTKELKSDLDNNVNHNISATVDSNGELKVNIINNADGADEEVYIDNFTITSYKYDINLGASLKDSNDDEILSNITLKDLPKGSTLEYSDGNAVDKVDGEYIVDITKLDEQDNITVTLFTGKEITTEQSNAITSSVTATEPTGDTATVERKMEDTGDATIVDGIIEGLYYETTSGFKGYTDENGEFDYYDGDEVTFKIGDLVVGSMDMGNTDDDKVFLQDLANVDRTDMNDEYVENMAVLLQSIDNSDGDNIVITQEMRDSFVDNDIDLVNISEEELAGVIEDVGKTAISEDDAMEHVGDMLEEYDGVEDGTLDDRVADDVTDDTLVVDEDIVSDDTLAKEDEIVNDDEDVIIDDTLLEEDVVDNEDEDDIDITEEEIRDEDNLTVDENEDDIVENIDLEEDETLNFDNLDDEPVENDIIENNDIEENDGLYIDDVLKTDEDEIIIEEEVADTKEVVETEEEPVTSNYDDYKDSDNSMTVIDDYQYNDLI